MRFNTHDTTPKSETKKSVRLMLAVNSVLIVSLFLFLAAACSLYIKSLLPAFVILTPVVVLAILLAISQKDMERAFIDITDDKITVTDFYFGIRREKTFSMSEIECAEIIMGYSMRLRGYRHSGAGCTYIVFRDKAGNYMFKLICAPETKQYFRKYLD